MFSTQHLLTSIVLWVLPNDMVSCLDFVELINQNVQIFSKLTWLSMVQQQEWACTAKQSPVCVHDKYGNLQQAQSTALR